MEFIILQIYIGNLYTDNKIVSEITDVITKK